MPPAPKSENRKFLAQNTGQISDLAKVLEQTIAEQRAAARSQELTRRWLKRLIKSCMLESEASQWDETLAIDGDPTRAWALSKPEEVPPRHRAEAEAALAKLTEEEHALRNLLSETRKRIKATRDAIKAQGPELS